MTPMATPSTCSRVRRAEDGFVHLSNTHRLFSYDGVYSSINKGYSCRRRSARSPEGDYTPGLSPQQQNFGSIKPAGIDGAMTGYQGDRMTCKDRNGCVGCSGCPDDVQMVARHTESEGPLGLVPPFSRRFPAMSRCVYPRCKFDPATPLSSSLASSRDNEVGRTHVDMDAMQCDVAAGPKCCTVRPKRVARTRMWHLAPPRGVVQDPTLQ